MKSVFNATICLILFATALQAQTLPAKNADPALIGILDDAREEVVNWKPGVAKDRLVRPAFAKDGTGWHQIVAAALTAQVRRTVAFNGRNLGNIEAVIASDGKVSAGRQVEGVTPFQAILTPAVAVPSVGIPSERFAPMGIGPTKGRRPLVVVSKPFFSDPDGWGRLPQPPKEITTLVRAAFRREFPHVDRCRNEEIVERNWAFPDSSLRFPIAYSSNKNSYLIETRLSTGDCGYTDDPNDPLSNPWFFVTPDRTVRRIGSFMSLLDAGDYDNDGRSELIFMVNQPEDTDGFVLYDADLRKQASLLWSYH